MEFYSHGKLLLTAEYAVLEGVKALAIPTKRGQGGPLPDSLQLAVGDPKCDLSTDGHFWDNQYVHAGTF